MSEPVCDPKSIGGVYLDTGYWVITEAAARKVCDGQLPRLGYLKIVTFQGQTCHVQRTLTSLNVHTNMYYEDGSRQVWALVPQFQRTPMMSLTPMGKRYT